MFLVRRNETICYLIGFGIGVGCCVVYRLLTNFLNSATNKHSSTDSQCDVSSFLKGKEENSITK